MTLEANKQLARDFFDAIAVGDTDRVGELMTDDATWWILPSTIFSGLHQKKEFLSGLPNLFAQADGHYTFRFDEITAEDNRVSLTAKGHLKMKSGTIFDSDYHFLLFMRDGKISAGKEYADTALVGECWGRPVAVETV